MFLSLVPASAGVAHYNKTTFYDRQNVLLCFIFRYFKDVYFYFYMNHKRKQKLMLCMKWKNGSCGLPTSKEGNR